MKLCSCPARDVKSSASWEATQVSIPLLVFEFSLILFDLFNIELFCRCFGVISFFFFFSTI